MRLIQLNKKEEEKRVYQETFHEYKNNFDLMSIGEIMEGSQTIGTVVCQATSGI